MTRVPDEIVMLLLSLLDHMVRCSFVRVNRQHHRCGCHSKQLRSVLEFGNATNEEVASLKRFGQTRIELQFCGSFNQTVDQLPVGLIRITFGESFNQTVDQLPATVTHITFGDSFNQTVDQLPYGVTHITFGWGFNQPVDQLPARVNHITFYYDVCVE